MEINYIHKTLEFISNKSYQLSDGDFFNEVSKFLANLFEVDYVLIDRCSTKEGYVQMESFFNRKDNSYLKTSEYCLKNTPCENVIGSNWCSYESDTKNLFPKDIVLTQLNIESYLGVSLIGAESRSIGLIAILDTKARPDLKKCLKALQIIALKVEKRLEQLFFNKELGIKNIDILQSKNRLEEAQFLANLGSFTLNVSDFTWECNTILDTIFGVDSSFVKDFKNLMQIVHEDDRFQIEKDINDILKNKISYYSREYKINRVSDQKVRWINAVGTIVLDE